MYLLTHSTTRHQTFVKWTSNVLGGNFECSQKGKGDKLCQLGKPSIVHGTIVEGSRGNMWRLTSPGNENVLICINAPFMTQRVLKSWWPWTYQNSAIKRDFARAVPGWVTSWEVWFGGAKSEQYCVIGGGSLQMVSEPLPSLRWWERAQAQEGRQRGRWVPRGDDCDVSHRLGMRMCLYV